MEFKNVVPLIHMIRSVKETRSYGETYIYAEIRKKYSGWNVVESANINGKKIRLSYTGWGRSLTKGGHRYKAHANFIETGKPVPSKQLDEITSD